MSAPHSAVRRTSLIILAVAALAAGIVTTPAAAGPGATRPATPVASAAPELPRSGSHPLPRVMDKANLPRRGSYAFLLELDRTPTLSTYRQARARGKAVAVQAAREQFGRVKAAQAAVIADLPAGARPLYRMHAVLAAVTVRADVRQMAALEGISGVRAVYPIAPKRSENAYAVPLQRAPEAWTAYGDLGQNASIAVIDTGVDYTHANFGGPGTSAAYNTALANDAAPADPNLFPNPKIINGYDLAGDAYDAGSSPVPAPDPNPLDCHGHGTHVAGTAAGFGVDSGGATFAGPYNTGTPFGSLRIGPGMAPRARLLAYKVFGCSGSTNLVADAIDMAADPNGDGDPSDRADVINMSLGSDFAVPQDGDAQAADAASLLGITVVASSGNGGDYYDIGGTPANAVRAIAVANSVDASNQLDHVHVSAPAGIVGDYGATRAVAYDWATKADLAGHVVELSQADNKDACAALSPADAAAVNGKVAFVEWTDDDTVRRCGSAARAERLSAAGAVGFILADDAETFSAGITGNAAIPGVLVIKSAGDAIRAALGDGVTVSGTGAGDFQQIVTADNDKVNPGSSRGIRAAGNLKPDLAAVGTSVFSSAMGTGNQGVAYSGSSMAAPMVAGEAALVRSMHPNWTPEEVKADLMNTAGQDLFLGDNHSGARYAPNRVGAGRIDAKSALDNMVLAYVQDNPGAVSVSFGPVAVTGATTVTKTLKVVNKSFDATTYALSYDAATTIPGVSYTVSSSQADPTRVTVPGRSSATVNVSLVVTDRTQLTKTIDPTMSRTQAGLPRNYVADASGRVVLTPVSGTAPTLRVPVHANVRPASVMTQPSSLTLPWGSTQQASLPLQGQGVSQGAGDEQIQSIVAGFELQAVSGMVPYCSATRQMTCVHIPQERAADVRYVATTSDAPQRATPMDGLAYFAINTYQPASIAASIYEYDISIDSTGDDYPDAVLYNTRLSGQDIFVSALVDLGTGDTLDVEPINGELGNVDTAELDSDTLVLPVAVAALPGVGVGHSRIRYAVATYGPTSQAPIDLLGLAHPYTTDVLQPGVMVSVGNSGVLYQDMPNTALTLTRNRAAYGADQGAGALIVHFHNRVGAKAQRVALMSRAQVALRFVPRVSRLGTTVRAIVTVANTAGAVPTGRVTLRVAGTQRFVARLGLRNGTATFVMRPPTRGVIYFYARYSGNNSAYLAGQSPVVRRDVI